jgi:hypothetical protein
MKKIVIALIAVFALAGYSFAANQIGTSVTSEPIAQGTSCGKGGGFSQQFDSSTNITTGDQLTKDLSIGVTLCRDIDLEISFGGSGGSWTATAITGNDNNGPVRYNDDTSGTTDDLTVVPPVYFRVTGNSGQSRIFFDVLGGGGIIVGPDPGDALIINYLGQKTNPDFLNDGLWIDDDEDGTYDVAAVVGDNTLCIDISNYAGTTVIASQDSKGDKYFFSPSNPQIAHVVAALAYTLDICEKDCGYIEIGERGGQGGTDTCRDFDFETGAGFCSAYTNEAYITSDSAPWTNGLTEYQIQLEILVNGQSGDNDVYWTSGVVAADAFDTISEGDVVSVRVTLLLAPCTTLISDTVCIGTFGCAAAVQECTFVINYLPNLTGPTWDSGFALANASARDANATVTFYEMDGDSGTWTTTIPAWDMEIFTNSLVSEITAISGSMGGSNCFATVHTDNTALHAFFMLWTDSLAQGSTASCCCQDCAQVLGTGSCP